MVQTLIYLRLLKINLSRNKANDISVNVNDSETDEQESNVVGKDKVTLWLTKTPRRRRNAQENKICKKAGVLVSLPKYNASTTFSSFSKINTEIHNAIKSNREICLWRKMTTDRIELKAWIGLLLGSKLDKNNSKTFEKTIYFLLLSRIIISSKNKSNV